MKDLIQKITDFHKSMCVDSISATFNIKSKEGNIQFDFKSYSDGKTVTSKILNFELNADIPEDKPFEFSPPVVEPLVNLRK